jgi:hypothetical protein
MESVTTDLRIKWQRFKARAQDTWFWQVFGVCAMRKLWTKFLVAVAIMAGFCSFYLGVDLLMNPILPLNQLNQTQGVLVHVYQPLRNAHGAKIIIRTDTGDEITFRGTMYDEAKTLLLAMKGKRVTVWSQPYYEIWLSFYYDRFWQVQDEERVLVSYDGYWIGRQHRKPTDIKLFKFTLTLTLLSLGIVIVACRRSARAE